MQYNQNMLIDEVELTFRAGHGGPGKVSFFPGRFKGPSGGNGGKGGDIYIKVSSDLTLLNQFSHKKLIEAENGQPGSNFKKTGANGHDLVVELPVGSNLVNLKTGQELDLDQVGQTLHLAKGGIGGKGNFELRSSTKTTPEYAQKGLRGEEFSFKIILKLIADFGLVGLPNSGKSSLLNELTRAKAQVGDYPFTTLEPNLGVTGGKIMADIPGLIEGAHLGKGLGIKFLKHIEKVGKLLFVVSLESEDPAGDFKIVLNELNSFNPELSQKDKLVILTKSDLVTPELVQKRLAEFKKLKLKAQAVSIHDWESLQKLKGELKL